MNEQRALNQAATAKMDELFEIYRDVYKVYDEMLADLKKERNEPVPWLIPMEFEEAAIHIKRESPLRLILSRYFEMKAEIEELRNGIKKSES